MKNAVLALHGENILLIRRHATKIESGWGQYKIAFSKDNPDLGATIFLISRKTPHRYISNRDFSLPSPGSENPKIILYLGEREAGEDKTALARAKKYFHQQ